MILDQLRDFCECVNTATDEDVADLINVVSMATCWAQNPCETFLFSARREVIDLPSCLDCPYEFTPYYHPFDKDSFKFTLVKLQGTEETETEVTDFAYIKSKDLFRLNLELPKCGCIPCVCGCVAEYKLIAEYDAGYSEIPECLLPVFCNILDVIHSKNKCDCGDCGCEDKTEDIDYATGDIVTVAIETDIGKMLVESYKNQLGMMSLCSVRPSIWGVIV